MAQTIGRVMKVPHRDGWMIDLRPYGRIYSLPLGGGKRLSLTEEMAEHVIQQIRSEVASGSSLDVAVAPYLPGKFASVPARVEAWLDYVRRRVAAGERSPTYLRALERYARTHFGYFAEASIYEINYGELEDWDGWLASKGLSAKTRRNILGAFSAFLHWLHRRGEIDAVPAFPQITPRRHVPTIISPADQDAVLAEIPEEKRGIFYLLVFHLARPGEARALNISDYSYRDRLVTIRAAMKGENTTAPRGTTKEDDLRRHQAMPILADWLEANTPAQRRLQGDQPLLQNRDAKNPEMRWSYWALRDVWNKARARAGIAQVTLYEGTKHSTATALRRAGVALNVIQHIVGHADSRSTEIYAKLSEQVVIEALRRRR